MEFDPIIKPQASRTDIMHHEKIARRSAVLVSPKAYAFEILRYVVVVISLAAIVLHSVERAPRPENEEHGRCHA